jgi:hypothetical protein
LNQNPRQRLNPNLLGLRGLGTKNQRRPQAQNKHGLNGYLDRKLLPDIKELHSILKNTRLLTSIVARESVSTILQRLSSLFNRRLISPQIFAATK